MKRIFITGCARSGTTLMNRLFYAFRDISVIDHEISIDEFCNYDCDTKILVGKRTPSTILSVPLSRDELDRHLAIIKKNDLLIVNVIRDGRDVVHRNPTGPQANVNRWIGCMLQAQLFMGIIRVQVRYEDLVVTPDSVQEKLAAALYLTPDSKFSEYPFFVPDSAFDEPEYRDFVYYSKRQITNASVGHSSDEYINLCESPKQQALFERTLKRYGYMGGVEEKIWDTGTLDREMEIHRQDSRELGFCL